MERFGEWTVAYIVGIHDPETIFKALESGQLPGCDLINGRMVCGRTHIGAAIQRLHNNPSLAVRGNRGTLAPLISALAPKSSVALKTFGYTGEGFNDPSASVDNFHAGRTVVAVMRSPTPEIACCVTRVCGGRLASLDELEAHADSAALQQVYGIAASELLVAGLCSCVTSHLAVCDL